MGRAIRAQPGGLRQHPGIPPIGFHAPTPFRIHRRVVRIGHDHLVAALLDRLRDPFALGRCLEQHARPRAAGEPLGEVLARALNPSFDHLALRRQDADLTFPLVDVDANMVHGWSPCMRLERD